MFTREFTPRVLGCDPSRDPRTGPTISRRGRRAVKHVPRVLGRTRPLGRGRACALLSNHVVRDPDPRAGAARRHPEALFRALRPRDPAVRDLLLRQGDVLREYAGLASGAAGRRGRAADGRREDARRALDRRVAKASARQRVAYLCPTIQLVNQVASKAHDYGLDVVRLVGRQASWDAAEFNRFQRGQAVGIAGYYQIFNSNPRLDSAQTLVFDDAHAAEEPLPRTGRSTRCADIAAFRALRTALGEHLPNTTRRRLEREDTDPRHRHDVSIVSPEAMPDASTEIEEALAEYATERDDPNRYTKEMIGPQMDRCLAYVSWSEILIRPLIPPTSIHRPFAGAAQRVYMSATLGSAGELQRAFGVATDNPSFAANGR